MTHYSSYDSTYSSIAQDDLEESIQPKDFLESKARFIYSMLKDHIRHENCEVAEIGPGQGFLIRQLIQNNIPADQITAIDIAKEYLDNLKEKGLKKLQANAEFLNLNDSFDTLICTDVAEHVINTSNLFVSINRSLKMDGVLLLGLPYRENLMPYAKELGCKYEFPPL